MKDRITASAAQVDAFSLSRHNLSVRAGLAELVHVASRMCGAQAQVMSAAEMSLGARLEGATMSDVRRSLWEERTLVKTWAMRGTLHLLPAKDLLLYVVALGRYLKEGVVRWLNRRGLDFRSVSVLSDAIVEALDREPLTRKELGASVGRTLGSDTSQWIEHSWGGVVKCAVLEGRVCFGPSKGNETTFVRVDRWLGECASAGANPDKTSQDEACAELLRRYLRAYGPADRRDYCAWSGLRAREADIAWKALEDELVAVSVDGGSLWLLSGDVAEFMRAETGSNVVRLLPNFDSYLLAHRDKTHLVCKAYYKEIYRRAGWIAPVILYEGRAVGTWSYRRKGGRIQVELAPFEPLLPDVRRMAEEEAHNLGRFLNMECDVLWK
ncbi:MAG: winged helix DNA-binding domain-containing protein [Firmicutes bacterium]|nr:winged helix DNA-binding domain-containing protein [Bacillota bacterium]MDD4792006.1 winged helix DNA-binding domain-containing protein [Bacillota bacterium]